MSAPESLEEALRDGWGEEDPEDFFDESEGRPVENEPPIELVSDRLRDRYRRAT
jgi:hypothetical protein